MTEAETWLEAARLLRNSKVELQLPDGADPETTAVPFRVVASTVEQTLGWIAGEFEIRSAQVVAADALIVETGGSL
jgi:hypothetical protein